MNFKYFALSILAITSTQIFSAECLYPHNEPLIMGDETKKLITQQARNTWEDWIWRGDIYQCASQGIQRCDYQWGKSVANAYAWNVGGTLNFDKIPTIGKYLPFSINAGYTKTKTLTSSYTWGVTLDKGWSAQPVQIIVRRWMRGVYKGTYVQTGAKCDGGGIGQLFRPARTSMYRFDPNRIATTWTSNVAISTKVKYHVFR